MALTFAPLVALCVNPAGTKRDFARRCVWPGYFVWLVGEAARSFLSKPPLDATAHWMSAAMVNALVFGGVYWWLRAGEKGAKPRRERRVMYGLTRNEALVVCYALKESFLPQEEAGLPAGTYLVPKFGDSIAFHQVAERLGVDKAKLREKVENLKRDNADQLVKAVKLLWDDADLATDEALRAVGLIG
ncbi:MAG TPA: hypothetical protein VMV27_15815 [Candidatus Binataceae bacterium]|nr:hypothetical protein [Candidatus Binataceae bacterium]